jgi:1,4-dihydroxy-2-naphthoyl-CoA synthase
MNSLQKATRVLNKNSLKCLASGLVRTQSSSANQQPLVLTDVNDKTGFATISLNRPPMSNFTLELLQEFSRALDEVESNKHKGMILTSVNNNRHSSFVEQQLIKKELHFLDISKCVLCGTRYE